MITISFSVIDTFHPNGWFVSLCILYRTSLTEQQQREFDSAAQRARNVRNDKRAYAIRYGR